MWTNVHVTGIPVAELLVQRHEMLLIERVLAFSGEEIEVLARDRFEPRADAERGVGDAEPLGVAARPFDRGGRNVGAEHLRLGPLVRHRERNGAAAGGEVEHSCRRPGRKP